MSSDILFTPYAGGAAGMLLHVNANATLVANRTTNFW